MQITEEPLFMVENKARPWGFWGTTILSAVLIILYFLIQFGVAFSLVNFTDLGSSIASNKDFAVNGFILSVSILVSAPICICLTLWFVRLRKGIAAWNYLGLNRFTKKEFIRWLLGMFAVMFFFDFLSWAIGRPLIPSVMVDAYETAGFAPAFFLAIIVAGPLFEEVLFRGFAFQGIEYSRLGTTGALWYTALFWTIMHVQYDLFGMANVLALGLLFGAARLKTGSTSLTLSLHCLNNLASTVQILLHVYLSA